MGDAGKTTPILDITANVGPAGAVMQGGTAFCGAPSPNPTLYVAITRRGAGGGATDTMLTIDTVGKRVANTVQLNMPALASHYATCGGSEGPQGVGGATTNAVVASSILILALDYMLTEIFFAQ